MVHDKAIASFYTFKENDKRNGTYEYYDLLYKMNKLTRKVRWLAIIKFDFFLTQNIPIYTPYILSCFACRILLNTHIKKL